MSTELNLPRFHLFDWKKLATYFLPVLVLAGLLVAKTGNKKTKAEEEFVTANTAFVKWDQILDKGSQEFTSLIGALSKHPELHAQYDASIAQGLLAVKAPEEAEPYIERTLKRTHQPYYSDYAKTSLMISKENYQEALNEALNLKEKMLSDASFWANRKEDSALFAFNLLRIATLHQQLNNPKGELDAWREIKHYGGWEGREENTVATSYAGFRQLLNHFSVQETTLLDYIQQREEALKNLNSTQ